MWMFWEVGPMSLGLSSDKTFPIWWEIEISVVTGTQP